MAGTLGAVLQVTVTLVPASAAAGPCRERSLGPTVRGELI